MHVIQFLRDEFGGVENVQALEIFGINLPSGVNK